MTCQKCGIGEGTQTWCESGAIGYVHGLSQQWCDRCVLTTQLAYARERAAAIPEL